jgi:hypothetical protein
VIDFLGQGLTGATEVSFNGARASFTVGADTHLTAVIPVDASTGAVTVVTPSGTLLSGRKFLVTQTLVPTVSIGMSKSAYSSGEIVAASSLRIRNPGAAAPVSLRLWLKVPQVGDITLLNIGSDGSFQLPPNFEVELGPVSLIPVAPDFPPRGDWELNSRITNPATGALISEDLNPFKIQ